MPRLEPTPAARESSLTVSRASSIYTKKLLSLLSLWVLHCLIKWHVQLRKTVWNGPLQLSISTKHESDTCKLVKLHRIGPRRELFWLFRLSTLTESIKKTRNGPVGLNASQDLNDRRPPSLSFCSGQVFFKENSDIMSKAHEKLEGRNNRRNLGTNFSL